MTLEHPSPAAENSWAGRRVLVTGADGFVGNWLVPGLAGQGAFVAALSRRPVAEGRKKMFQYGENIHAACADVTSLEQISLILAELKIDTIYHLAASNVNTGTRISPYEVYETNIRGVYTVLEAARQADRPVGTIIASSKEVEDCFLPESRRKFHPYMTSKAAAEMIARAYADAYGLAVAVLRSQNLYGGGDLNWNRLVPGIIKSICQGQSPVIRGDGLTRRDYLYIEDAIAAYLALGLRLEKPGIRGKLFRIATGSGISVLEMVRAIMRAAGLKDLNPQMLNQPSESRIDTPYRPEYERETLGWQSRFTLEEGLARTWQWYQNHFQSHPLERVHSEKI